MSRWLLDASVLLAAEDRDDENYSDARRLLVSRETLVTLDLAYYEVANVAVRAWRDLAAAARLRERVAALANDGGLIRADEALLADAEAIADDCGISVYDAAYVAAARSSNSQLVSCDRRDLVARDLALLPSSVPTTS